MPRYRKINEKQCSPGEVVRIVNEHTDSKTKITIEGPITEVITEAMPRIVQVEYAARTLMVPVGLKFEGGQVAALRERDGWRFVSLDVALPDLPTTEGSVVTVDGRAAILSTDAEGEGIWLWADEFDVRVTDYSLEKAEIIHRARR